MSREQLVAERLLDNPTFLGELMLGQNIAEEPKFSGLAGARCRISQRLKVDKENELLRSGLYASTLFVASSLGSILAGSITLGGASTVAKIAEVAGGAAEGANGATAAARSAGFLARVLSRAGATSGAFALESSAEVATALGAIKRYQFKNEFCKKIQSRLTQVQLGALGLSPDEAKADRQVSALASALKACIDEAEMAEISMVWSIRGAGLSLARPLVRAIRAEVEASKSLLTLTRETVSDLIDSP